MIIKSDRISRSRAIKEYDIPQAEAVNHDSIIGIQVDESDEEKLKKCVKQVALL